MKPYLFTLTISPVQSFIAQARKSQDLFAGSEILSQLMGKVLDEFKNDTVIFPQNKNALSNKIVVKLKNKTEEEIKKIGEDLKKCVNRECVTTILETTKQGDSTLNNFFQVFWVAVELGNDYQKSYKQLERNLGAIKNLRTFHQEGQVAGHQKCSLCGERNIVKTDKEDGLCLICYTKRIYKQDGDKSIFPTLSDIVVLNKKGKPKDAHQYLSDNSTEKKHYALLHFDVDSLGKTLSGLDMQGQKDLSTALGDFAQKVGSEVLTSQKGRTVYAGGDDFLGFVNLAYLFDVLNDIHKAFDDEVKTLFPNLTFSTSIVIAHYKTPLHKVLDYSRELLEESKKHFEDKKKNGIGIMVMSSNAVISKTICRYGDVALLQKMKKAEMAKNLHFKLAQIFDYLESQKNMEKEHYNSLILILEYEIKRLLKRGEGNFDETLYEKLVLFLHTQVSGLKTKDKIKINFDNFIGFLKTLEQLRNVM